MRRRFSRSRCRILLPLLMTLTAGLFLAAPIQAGPPWISIELPANPHNPTTSGALLVVHAYHHAGNVQYPLSGTAEGLVGGERRSVALTIRATDRAGIYAVSRPRLDEGRWMLVIRLDTGEGGGATALVSLDGEAEVAGVRVPSKVSGDGWTIPRDVSAREIDTMLREGGFASWDAGAGGLSTRAAGMAGVLALILIPIALRRRS